MILVSDPIFGEVELTGSATELAHLAHAVAKGEGFISSQPATAPNTLAGVEVREAPGPGVLIHLDSQRQILAINGNPDARALFADNLRAMTTVMASEDGGGHRHIDHFPGIPSSLRDLCPWSSASPMEVRRLDEQDCRARATPATRAERHYRPRDDSVGEAT